VRAMLYSGMVGEFMAKVLLAHPGINVNEQDEVRSARGLLYSIISKVRCIQFANNCVTFL